MQDALSHASKGMMNSGVVAGVTADKADAMREKLVQQVKEREPGYLQDLQPQPVIRLSGIENKDVLAMVQTFLEVHLCAFKMPCPAN